MIVLFLFFGVKIVLAIIAGAGTTTPGTSLSSGALTCADTDGTDIYTRGSTTYTYYINGIDGDKATNTMYDECNGVGTQIKETYCYRMGSGNVVSGIMVSNCQYGCANGACKRSADENPTPIPTMTATPGKLTCTDTDANDIYNRGSTTYSYYVNGRDDEGGRATNIMYDECNGAGTQVHEMWCYKMTNGSEDFVSGDMVYNCQYGCVNGACKRSAAENPTIIPTMTATPGRLTCKDTDDILKPNDIYATGSVTYTYFVNGKDDKEGRATSTISDECNGAGTQVNEMYCYKMTDGSENYVNGRMVYNCPNGCVNGACKTSTTTPIIKKVSNKFKRLFKWW